MSNFVIDMKLTNQKVQFTGVSESNPDHPVQFDYMPPLGDGQGFAGIEALLMSFSGCVSTAVVALLRKTGKNVAGYEARATGIRQENPVALKKIFFFVRVCSNDITPADMDKVFAAAKEISPVWLAIKNNVEVVTDYQLVADSAAFPEAVSACG